MAPQTTDVFYMLCGESRETLKEGREVSAVVTFAGARDVLLRLPDFGNAEGVCTLSANDSGPQQEQPRDLFVRDQAIRVRCAALYLVLIAQCWHDGMVYTCICACAFASCMAHAEVCAGVAALMRMADTCFPLSLMQNRFALPDLPKLRGPGPGISLGKRWPPQIQMYLQACSGDACCPRGHAHTICGCFCRVLGLVASGI